MDVKAKKLRREGYVTGNLFGREIEGSLPIQMTKKAVDQLLKTDNKGSQVMLEVDGKTYDALIKEVDYNAMANRVDEIDFQALVSTEKVHSVAENSAESSGTTGEEDQSYMGRHRIRPQSDGAPQPHGGSRHHLSVCPIGICRSRFIGNGFYPAYLPYLHYHYFPELRQLLPESRL